MIPYHGFANAVRPTHTSLHLHKNFLSGPPFLRAYSISKSGIDDGVSSSTTSLPFKVRTLMRSTPHPVTTIISYTSKPSSSNDSPAYTTPCGLLVSSFNTITLDPKPCVSFNIKRPSRTYDAIYESGSFTASSMYDASIAQAFVQHGGSVKGWERMVSNGGRLEKGKGGIWWMSCALMREKCVSVGDHVIVIGEVVDAAAYPAGEGELGLVYAQGKYWTVESVVDANEKG